MLPVMYECEIWHFILGEEYRLILPKNLLLKRVLTKRLQNGECHYVLHFLITAKLTKQDNALGGIWRACEPSEKCIWEFTEKSQGKGACEKREFNWEYYENESSRNRLFCYGMACTDTR
jgi:hypothetical protein